VFRPFGYDLRRRHDLYADLRRLLPDGAKTLFDVGANVGDVTARLRRCFPGAAVHCFEPFDNAFGRLRDRFREDPNVHPVQSAVAERCGSATSYLCQKDTCNSLLAPAAEARDWVSAKKITNVGSMEVPLVTLDEYCRKEAIDRIDFLKIDVQGAEMLVLRGAEGLLARSAISLLYLEANFVPLYQGQASFHELLAHLAERGYALFNLYDWRHGRRLPQLLWANALFVTGAVRSAALKAAGTTQP